MNAVASFPPPSPEAKLNTAGEKRDDVASPRLFTTRARVDGHENRGPISERARLIVDVGADCGFAVAAAVGRDRLTVAGAAAGSIATAARRELDVVRDDLGGMALLAVLAFPIAKGQFAEDNYSLALLHPFLGRLRRLAEAQAVVPVGYLVVFLAAVHRNRELHALGLSVAAVETEHLGVLAQVAHQLHFCESHLVSSFCAGWRALLLLLQAQFAGLARASGSRSCPAIRFLRGHGGALPEANAI